ncbi:MAG: family 1 encapsulin nanocompartment shell protein [Spirochaetota bacterium]
MDIFRRNLAPVSSAAWDEINSVARETLIANLSARRFVDISGPHGLGYASVNIGRLSASETHAKSGVSYGVHTVMPLVEARAMFTLGQWELDNIERGARDIELDALIEASRKIAAFEEDVVYNGFPKSSVEGLNQAASESTVPVKLNPDSIIDAISEAQGRLILEGIEGPAILVVNPELWKVLARAVPGGTLRSLVEKQIEGRVIYSGAVNGGMLVSARGGDTELSIGQDIAIGYHSHTNEEITFFMTESFTFRVIAPEAIIGLVIG